MQASDSGNLLEDNSLTIVVPVTEMAGKLQLLESWLSQTAKLPVTVILVHDLRDLTTGLELRDLLSKLASESIILKEGTFGNPGSARNYGLSLAESTWIAFWDSDDMPSLEIVCEHLFNKKTNCEIILFDFETVDEITQEKTSYRILDTTPRNLNRKIALHPGLWRFVFRRNSLKEIGFPNISMGEDQILLSRLNIEARKLCHVNEIGYTYMIGRVGQLTKNSQAIQDLRISIHELQSRLSLNSEFNVILLLRQLLTLVKRGTVRNKIYAFKILSSSFIFSGLTVKKLMIINLFYVIKEVGA